MDLENFENKECRKISLEICLKILIHLKLLIFFYGLLTDSELFKTEMYFGLYE